MRAWIRNLVKVKDTPEALARGLAVGLVGLAGGVVVYFSSDRLLAALRRWHERRSSTGEAPRPSSNTPNATIGVEAPR